jgi:hypothetical protein
VLSIGCFVVSTDFACGFELYGRRRKWNKISMTSFLSTSPCSVIAEMVSLRTREIAIRLALGSDRLILVRRLIGRTMCFVLIGEIMGLLASLSLAARFPACCMKLSPTTQLFLESCCLAY